MTIVGIITGVLAVIGGISVLNHAWWFAVGLCDRPEHAEMGK